MTSAGPIHVMVVDNHPVVRVGITAMLADCEDIAVVAAVDGAAEAVERCRPLGVRVVLMDLCMPEIDGATATTLLRERCPDVLVVVLTGSVMDSAPVVAAIQAGASAALFKTVGKNELADVIRGVTEGRSTFASELLPYLVGRPEDQHPKRTGLTAREHDILSLLASGQTNKQIARALRLSDGTVRVYVSSILAKLGAANRTEATVMAIRLRLVDDQP